MAVKTVLITTSSFREHLLDMIRGEGYEPVLNPFGRKLTGEEAAQLLLRHRPVGMIAGVEPLTREVLTGVRELRVISRCGIGLDSVDLETARELGIVVTNTPDAPTVPAAELTLGLILALLRGIPRSDASIRSGRWTRPMGRLLGGKTVGIIGCGRIGTRVAGLLSAFGCRCLGYDPHAAPCAPVERVPLSTLLARSHVVTLHLPYSEATRHFLDARRLGEMQKGAMVVNAARGGLIDEGALEECLRSGHLAGAALDCFENEPYTGPLRDLDNVVLTGHIGSYAQEARVLMEEQATEHLVRELRKVLGV